MKVCSWNIARSLNEKLTNTDFVNNLKSFDIVFLTECWCKDIDTEVNIEGFCEPIILCRKKMRGGGIVLFFKEWLKNYICVEKTCADTYMWIKLDKLATGYCTDVFLCLCYLPPENTRYYECYDVDLFEMIENDMITYKSRGKIMILGDLNSRIGLRNEQIENDRLNDELHQKLNSVIEYVTDDNLFTHHRFSMDTHVNTFGRKLLEFCKTTQMLILNGRHSDDKGVNSRSLAQGLGCQILIFGVYVSS